jgi:hypothetical protein
LTSFLIYFILVLRRYRHISYRSRLNPSISKSILCIKNIIDFNIPTIIVQVLEDINKESHHSIYFRLISCLIIFQQELNIYVFDNKKILKKIFSVIGLSKKQSIRKSDGFSSIKIWPLESIETSLELFINLLQSMPKKHIFRRSFLYEEILKLIYQTNLFLTNKNSKKITKRVLKLALLLMRLTRENKVVSSEIVSLLNNNSYAISNVMKEVATLSHLSDCKKAIFALEHCSLVVFLMSQMKFSYNRSDLNSNVIKVAGQFLTRDYNTNHAFVKPLCKINKFGLFYCNSNNILSRMNVRIRYLRVVLSLFLQKYIAQNLFEDNSEKSLISRVTLSTFNILEATEQALANLKIDSTEGTRIVDRELVLFRQSSLQNWFIIENGLLTLFNLMIHEYKFDAVCLKINNICSAGSKNFDSSLNREILSLNHDHNQSAKLYKRLDKVFSWLKFSCRVNNYISNKISQYNLISLVQRFCSLIYYSL